MLEGPPKLEKKMPITKPIAPPARVRLAEISDFEEWHGHIDESLMKADVLVNWRGGKLRTNNERLYPTEGTIFGKSRIPEILDDEGLHESVQLMLPCARRRLCERAL